MAQYTFDPNQYPTGSLPSGWTEYGFSGKATIQNDPPFGNYLRVNNQNTPAFDGMVAWTELGVIDSTQWPLEIVARVRWSNSDISSPGPLYADPSTWNGYSAVLEDRNNYVHLRRADAASLVSVAQSGVGSVVEGEVWWIKWRIESGGRHLIKAWKDGDAEPAGWHIDVIDTTYSSGYIGVEIQRFGQNHYFWLGVGTNGDPAPTSPQPASIDTSASLALSSPTTSGQVGLPSVDTSASLQFTTATTSGAADQIKEASAALALTSVQIDGVANEARDTSASLQLTGAQASGIVRGPTTANASFALVGPQVSGQATATQNNISASLQLDAPAITASVGRVVSAALRLAPAVVNGRSQLYPSVYGNVKAGALAFLANADAVDIAFGRVRTGALALAAKCEPVRSASGQIAVAALALQTSVSQVLVVPGGNVRCGALQLNARAELLQQLSHADVSVEEALVASVEVHDVIDVAVDLLD